MRRRASPTADRAARRDRPDRAHLAGAGRRRRRTASSTSTRTSGRRAASAASTAAWWLARASAEPLRASVGSLVFVVPTIGMAGAAEFTMLAAVAEGVRVLAKGCGRQWGADGVTVNTIAAAPHHWLDADTADSLTRAISLSTPAFGASRGDVGRRPRAARRAARRSRRALPHRRHAGGRRRHLDGAVSTGTPNALLDGRTVVVTGAGRRRRPRHRARVRDPRRPRRDRGAPHRDRRRRRGRDRRARRCRRGRSAATSRSAPTSTPRSRSRSRSSAAST